MKTISLIALPVLAGCLLSACGGPPRTRAEQAAISTCRQRADQAFMRQNRALLSERDSMNTPFASNELNGITSANLGRQYARDEMMDNCIAGTRAPDTGAATITRPQAPAPASAAPLTTP